MAVIKNAPEPTKPGHRDSLADRILDKLAHWIAFRTLPMFFTILFLMIIITLAGLMAGNMNFTEDSDSTWEIASGTLAKQKDALNLAILMADPVDNSTISLRSEANNEWSLVFLYDLDTDEDILQAAFLKEICETEKIVFNLTAYSNFCVLDTNGDCATQSNSIVSLFYGPEPNCTLLDETFVSNKADEIYNAVDSLEGKIQYGTFIGRDALARNATVRFSRLTKSVINFGAPLPGFTDSDDRSDDQDQLIMDNLFEDLEKDLFDHFGMSDSYFVSFYRQDARLSRVNVRWFSETLSWIEFERLINSDMGFAALSIVFVLFWMRVHTGSCFIALFGMLQIVLSLPIAAFFYGSVFGVPYFQILHVLIIFLVLGIGADDIFVYHDGWKQTRHEKRIASIEDDEKYLFERVRSAYSHTARAVFNTSFTTAVAFLSQTGSEIMPIRSLGIYATLAIVLNYILAISFTPVVVLIAERHFQGFRWGDRWVTCCWAAKVDADHAVDTPMTRKRDVTAKATESALEEAVEKADTATGPVPDKEMPAMGKYLEKLYATPILYTTKLGDFNIKPIGLFVFVGLIAYAAQAFHFSFELTPPNKQEQWFPDDHMWTGFFDDLQNNYISQTDEQYMVGRMSFGITGLDRSGYDFWRPGKNLGTPEFDDVFDPTTESGQRAFLDACTLLRERECTTSGCDIPFLAFPASVRCWMEDFRDWMDENQNITLPANILKSTFITHLKSFRAENPSFESEIGFINDELKFAIVDFQYTTVIGAGHDKTGESIDLKDDLRLEITANSSSSTLGTVLITGDEFMVFFDTQEALIRNLIQGLGISTPVVFFLLLLATKNLQIAFVAVFSVLSIVASVLGMCQLIGWDLGIAEAIAGVIVIGFAVDYTLHLGHMYMEAAKHGHTSREDRFRFAIGTMGGTVVAGAVTTFGSGCFMFLAQMTFFYKMAVLMCSTIGFSFLFSFGFFMAHCAVIGPQGDFATIPVDKIRAKCCGGKAETKA